MNILLKEAAPDILTEFNKELDAIILGYPTWSMNFKEGYKSAIRDFKLILKQEYGIDLDEVGHLLPQAVMSSSEPIVLKGRMRDEQAEQEADDLLLESLLQGITEGEKQVINKPEGE